jgi:hypothetical protein
MRFRTQRTNEAWEEFEPTLTGGRVRKLSDEEES